LELQPAEESAPLSIKLVLFDVNAERTLTFNAASQKERDEWISTLSTTINSAYEQEEKLRERNVKRTDDNLNKAVQRRKNRSINTSKEFLPDLAKSPSKELLPDLSKVNSETSPNSKHEPIRPEEHRLPHPDWKRASRNLREESGISVRVTKVSGDLDAVVKSEMEKLRQEMVSQIEIKVENFKQQLLQDVEAQISKKTREMMKKLSASPNGAHQVSFTKTTSIDKSPAASKLPTANSSAPVVHKYAAEEPSSKREVFKMWEEIAKGVKQSGSLKVNSTRENKRASQIFHDSFIKTSLQNLK